jgi:hypothetical protein
MMKYVIFLDIDGVLALVGMKLEPTLVDNLNYLVKRFNPEAIEIVLNTAWNIKTLDKMKDLMIQAGFLFPECLIGQTSGTSGGGVLARDWLSDNGRVGTPYIMIDDSTKVQESWSRLVRCNTKNGFTRFLAKKAFLLLKRGISNPEIEKHFAVKNIAEFQKQILNKSQWLSHEQRLFYVKELNDQMSKILSMSNSQFMKASSLRQ